MNITFLRNCSDTVYIYTTAKEEKLALCMNQICLWNKSNKPVEMKYELFKKTTHSMLVEFSKINSGFMLPLQITS